MIINAYSIYDRKALRYHAPFYSHQDGEAARSFADLVNDPNTTVGRHPDDYVLYRVGAYDDANGSLLPANVLDHVADGSSLVRNYGPGPDIYADLSETTAATVQRLASATAGTVKAGKKLP